jgi:hypothetical protein
MQTKFLPVIWLLLNFSSQLVHIIITSTKFNLKLGIKKKSRVESFQVDPLDWILSRLVHIIVTST